MQVGARNPARGTHQAQDFAAFDLYALSDLDFAEMAIHRDQALAVIEKYRVAVEVKLAGDSDCAWSGCCDRRARAGGNVQPAMWTSWLIVEDAPVPERAGSDPAYRLDEGANTRCVLLDEVHVGRPHARAFGANALQILFDRVDHPWVGDGQALFWILFGIDGEGVAREFAMLVENVERVLTGGCRQRYANYGIAGENKYRPLLEGGRCRCRRQGQHQDAAGDRLRGNFRGAGLRHAVGWDLREGAVAAEQQQQRAVG